MRRGRLSGSRERIWRSLPAMISDISRCVTSSQAAWTSLHVGQEVTPRRSRRCLWTERGGRRLVDCHGCCTTDGPVLTSRADGQIRRDGRAVKVCASRLRRVEPALIILRQLTWGQGRILNVDKILSAARKWRLRRLVNRTKYLGLSLNLAL